MKILQRPDAVFVLGIMCFFYEGVSFASIFDGTLYVKGSRDTLPNATLYLLPQKIKITTDEKGHFSTPPLPEGDFKWVANISGFNKFERQDHSVAGEEILQRKFFIQQNADFVYETTITSKENQDTALTQLSTKEAQGMPGAGLDPVKAVQNLPGINRTPGFGSQVIIQGSAPQDTKYSIDGQEIPIIFHFAGLSSVLIPEFSSSIDYLAAGYQANYGRAMGGVINLNTIDLESKRTKGMAFVDIFNSGGAVEVPLDDHQSIAAGVRASYVGEVLKAVIKNGLTVAPNFDDLTVIYQNQIRNDLKLKIVSIGSIDTLGFVINDAGNSDPVINGSFSEKTGFFRIFPELTWTQSQASKTTASLGIGRDFVNTQIGSDYFNLRSSVIGYRADQEVHLNSLWKLNVGADGSFRWSDVQFQLPEFISQGGVTDPLATTQTKTASILGAPEHIVGLYWSNQLKLSENSPWTLYPGLRFDDYTMIHDASLSPRLSIRYQYTPTLAFITAGGLYTEPPEPQYYSPSYGNPNLKHSTAYHLTIKAEKDLSESVSKGSSLYSGVFARWFNHLVISDPTVIWSNGGSGRAIGFENSFTYKFSPWSIYLAYTLSRSIRWDANHAEYLYQYDQPQLLTIIGSVDLPRNWKISSRFRYVSGTLSTIPVGSALDTDHDVYIPINGALYQNRLDPFIMLDLRLDKKWVYDVWTLSMYIDIQNILNRQNPEGIQFGYNYQTNQTIPGIPILPTVGLKGEF